MKLIESLNKQLAERKEDQKVLQAIEADKSSISAESATKILSKDTTEIED